MADHIQVDISQLQQASSRFNQSVSSLEGILGDVNGQINNLQSTWQGQAATDFHSLMERWTKDFNDMQHVLQTIGFNLNRAATDYGDSDHGIAKGFQPQ